MLVAYKLLSNKEKCVCYVCAYIERERWRQIGRDYRCGKNVLKYVLVFQFSIGKKSITITQTRIPSIKRNIILYRANILGFLIVCKIFGRLVSIY